MDLLVLQNYLRTALGNWPPLQALIAQRIYDRVPKNGDFPYVTIGVVDGNDITETECLELWEAVSQVHVWSRSVGFPEGKAIAIQVSDALRNRYPVWPGFRVKFFRPTTQIWMNDPDGLTTHGVLEFLSRYGPED